MVTGPRQTGKSRLLQLSRPTALARHAHFDLDDPLVRAAASADPTTFVQQAPRMVVDEVQRVPELMLAVKAEVDRELQRTKGRFVLTGSANLLMMRQVADSLAGRAAYLPLQPMTRREVLGLATTGTWTRFFELPFEEWRGAVAAADVAREDWREVVRRGGFPVPALHLEVGARDEWFRGYVATYLERDLRDISAIEDLGDFRRAMQAFALRAGTPVSHADVARELGLVDRTLRRWLELLDVTYQLARLPAYTVRRATRLRKRPKFYWNDSALAMHVAGDGEPAGTHLETLVFTDLRAWAALDERRPLLHYWRDDAGREVDFVVERDGRTLAVEVKATRRPGPDDWQHLKHFVSEYERSCVGALLLHDGEETLRVADRVVAAPWWRVL
ncbi:MAG: ATP-binding protein [Gemmatimonadaceae bacterium]